MNALPRIALIDDDRAWLDALSEYLEGKGFQVQTAQGAVAGLALLEDPAIGLAVVDVHMPGMSGLELLRQLRHRDRDVAVVLLSSDDDPSLPVRARAEGARGFLSKTLPPPRLLRALLQALAARESGAAEPARANGRRFLPVPRFSRRYLPVPLRLFRRAGI